MRMAELAKISGASIGQIRWGAGGAIVADDVAAVVVVGESTLQAVNNNGKTP
jgi:hypothetical protein